MCHCLHANDDEDTSIRGTHAVWARDVLPLDKSQSVIFYWKPNIGGAYTVWVRDVLPLAIRTHTHAHTYHGPRASNTPTCTQSTYTHPTHPENPTLDTPHAP